MMENNPIILSFHDSVIRESDEKLLHGPYWLNDNIIAFYFEYLEHVVKPPYDTCYITPSVTQFIKTMPSQEVGIFLEPLELHKKGVVFLAVNDSEALDTPSGTHWSLLVYNRARSKLFHYDSMNGANDSQALSVTQNILPYLNDDKAEFCSAECRQQQNSHDCGIHVICNAEHITGKYMYFVGPSEKEIVMEHDLRGKREDLIRIISELRNR